jgi:hypothetical protein
MTASCQVGRVHLSEHAKLITEERQVNSIEARLSAAQNSNFQVGWRMRWGFRIWLLRHTKSRGKSGHAADITR